MRGDPSERRRYLDEVATTRRPRIAGVRADYDKVVRQRTALLKSAARRGTAETRPCWIPSSPGTVIWLHMARN